MHNMLTIRQAVERLKEDGLPLSEYALRLLVKRGATPAPYAGQKALVYCHTVISYIQCTDGCDNAPPSVAAAPGIRRVDL